MKNILYIWFSQFTLTETHRCQNYSLLLYLKKNLPRLPIYLFTGNESKTPLKLLECGRKIRNDVHTDTYYCKPKIVSWRQLNITVFYTRFLSPTDQLYAVSSMYWQFLDYRSPVNFDRYTLKCDAKNSTSICIYISYYHPLDNRYGFSLSIGNTKNDHVATSTCLEWQLKYVNVSIILALEQWDISVLSRWA